ncbi:cell division protein FtsL [Aneurinibacillus sp. Ricciae_BoGa-3]|uniref:cell division protein FtsL n=1 Tax=Aneurinibacillus sp. Ricciae_BoGa-3 TaxID=3022697 RepID=UPI00233FF6D5|nr:cell division protein FtsL [Aneurinibacillus sp. Ricciae_BoGa-3]WCK53091.1 cell division protein FtsL [Aneurinibacillus sp. Ricciae_BoGa-3]
MRRYNQGNLATNIERKPKQKVVTQKRVIIRQGISGTEKLIYFGAILLLVAMCSFIIARYAQISDYNYQVIRVQNQIKQIGDETADLKVQVDVLSKPERIRQIAEKMGLTKNEATVRIVKNNASN